MARVSGSKIINLVLIDGLRTVLYFPLWWYTKGFFMVIKGCWAFIVDTEQTLGLMIWVKNLFVPMFGQRDFAGRFISFIMRIIQIIFRGIFLIMFVILNIAFLLLWLILPFFVIYQIFSHFFSFFYSSI